MVTYYASEMSTTLAQATSVTELLQALVKIGSVSPDSSATGTTDDFVGEENLAKHLQSFLENKGATVELDYVLPNRPNLIARMAPVDGRPRVLLGPHLDTVDVCQMSIPPFDAYLKEEKVWGRGSSDTKGPMASMIWAWLEQVEHHKNASVAIDFVAFCGEESYQQGSKHFADKYADQYQFALVGEPTSLQLVHVSKGALWVRLSSEGVSAHSSQPHLGENAILKLGKVLDKLQNAFANLTKNDQVKHPILGDPTMNVGVIHGGSRPNVVPSEAYALVDFRTTPALAGKEGLFPKLQEICENEHWGVALSMENEERLPMQVEAGHPVIAEIQSAVSTTQCVGAPWFSDAALLSNAGIPSVCVGPGSIDQAHTKDEFIKVSDLIDGADFFSKIIKKLSNIESIT